jgi:alpha-L-fucosidase
LIRESPADLKFLILHFLKLPFRSSYLPFVFLLACFEGFVVAANAQEKPTAEYMTAYKDIMDRTAWWREARFGMFIHFSDFALTMADKRPSDAQSRWVLDNFQPKNFDAKKWARIAREAGMKYAVLTVKHHDGFCMFDSKLTDFKISNSFGGRDVFKEFVDAFRAEGLKVGFYYSLIDWHHPDYPPVGNHPLKGDSARMRQKSNWSNYIKYFHGQVEELTKNYGKIDIAWFDFAFEEYEGEKWESKKLVAMIKKNQPSIIINNRLKNFSFTQTSHRLPTAIGDFETPEQGIPELPIIDRFGQPFPWETCLTMNNNWAFSSTDREWKSTELLIQSLVNCVSKNGNMLLNIGPDATGNIPDEAQERLRAIGKWMDKNGESIYGCGMSKTQKPEWGRLTQKGQSLFAHWLYPNLGPICLKINGDSIKSVFQLANGIEAYSSKELWINHDPGNFFMNVNTPIDASFERPDQFDTVFKIELR